MLEIGRAGFGDEPAHRTRSGEADDRHGFVSRERRTGIGPVAAHQVHDASRHTRFGQYLYEVIRGKRRIFGGFQHDRISADQGRHHLPRGNGHREIPRRDHPADADGLPHAHGEFVGQFRRRGLTKEPAAFAGHVVGHVDGFLHVAARFFEDFTHFAGHVLGKILFALDEQLGGAEQNFRAFGRGYQPPFFVCFCCRFYRRIDIFVGRGHEHSHQLIAVRGVAVFVGFARARLHPFAVDKVLENPWRYCRGHTSSWCFTRLPDFDPGRCGKAARATRLSRQKCYRRLATASNRHFFARWYS